MRNAAAGEVLTEGIYGKHIKCLRLDIIDESWYDVSKHIDGALEFIAEAKAKKAGILVHCVAGVSRSVTVASLFHGLVSNRALPPYNRFNMCSVHLLRVQ